jgi:hypothetical protein
MSKIALSIFALHFIFVTSQAFADDPPVDPKLQFCDGIKSGKSFYKTRIMEAGNSWGFSNTGGLKDQGVCWWRTRLQWTVAHLAVFYPDRPKPDTNSAWKILRDLSRGDRVVAVPGYKSFFDFTADNSNTAQSFLDMFQLYDGVLGGGWISGLKGNPSAPPEVMKKAMDELYEYVVKRNNVAYVFLQLKGRSSHAISVVDLTPTETGYNYKFVDSNHPQRVEELPYKFGDTTWPFWDGVMFYVRKKDFLQKMQSVGTRFCKQETLLNNNSEL